VSIGRVNGAKASQDEWHVWGANARNWNLNDGEAIIGDGQAAAMGNQHMGVFGIVTTPFKGVPEQEEDVEESEEEEEEEGEEEESEEDDSSDDSDDDETKDFPHWFNSVVIKTECGNQCKEKKHKGCARVIKVQLWKKAPNSWLKYCKQWGLKEFELPSRKFAADFEEKLEVEMGELWGETFHKGTCTGAKQCYDHLVFKCCFNNKCKCPTSSKKKKKK